MNERRAGETAEAGLRVQSYYDVYWSAGGYCPPGILRAEVQELLDPLVRSGARCVDVGCGDGRGAGAWLSARGCDYVGLDVSPNAVEMARQLGLDARVIVDPARLPLGDDLFDVALCTEVFEHLFEPHLVAADILRVLKPGGVLIATVPNTVYWMRRLAFLLAGKWNPMGDDLAVAQPWRDPHIRFFTARALREMLELVGFAGVEVGGHAGGFLRDLPVLGPRARGRDTSVVYRRVERHAPALLALRLHAVGAKP